MNRRWPRPWAMILTRRSTKRRRNIGATSARRRVRRRCRRAQRSRVLSRHLRPSPGVWLSPEVVTAEQGRAAQKDLRPGQRLVTQQGDLWRWDGFSVSADAPSQAAIRLEQRNRLNALEQEFAAAKMKRVAAQAAYATAQNEAAAANESARTASRVSRETEAALIRAQDAAARAARVAAERAAGLATLKRS